MESKKFTESRRLFPQTVRHKVLNLSAATLTKIPFSSPLLCRCPQSVDPTGCPSCVVCGCQRRPSVDSAGRLDTLRRPAESPQSLWDLGLLNGNRLSPSRLFVFPRKDVMGHC